MAGTYDYFVSDSVEDARNRVAASIAAQGFTVEATPAGGFMATRGSRAKTVWLGAFAGKDMHVRFDVQFFQDGDRIVVRLSRDLAVGALKGGAIGASRLADLFQNFANRVGTDLQRAGVLVETREV
jgi:hypothetical protein